MLAGGVGRRTHAFRLPDVKPTPRHPLTCRIELQLHDEDNVLHVSATLEDGNVLWSSPIYLLTRPQTP